MVAATLVMISLAFVAGFSVVGVLQSTERVSSSGIMVQPAPPPLPPPSLPPSSSRSSPRSPPPSSPPPPPPSEPTIDIDVYNDRACTQLKSSVVWGEIEAGGSVSEVIFIKNEGDGGVVLVLTTENWDPVEAADDMQLSWDYDDSTIEPGAVLEITLTLAVNSSISGIDVFSFDIVIFGSET